MKKLIKLSVLAIIAAALIIPTAAEARTYNPHHGPTYNVHGYTKKNGTYVHPYRRTYPNHTKSDNLYLP